MALTNTNKNIIDVPYFELMNQLPTATTAISCTCTQDDRTYRFIYYIVSGLFYRYDTFQDTVQQLASPNVTPTVLATMRYTGNRGYHSRIISATSSTVRFAGMRERALNGKQLRIEFGTGSGQTRTLTWLKENIHDAGVITATTTLALGDALKKWKINQWAGYVVGITFGTNVTQYKKILYNDTNNLYVSDANLQPHDPWKNQPFQANAPYALPVITAGSQAHYQIISQDYTLNADWTVTPNDTSFATALTGGIYLMTPSNLQYYDILHDQWQTKTLPASMITSALGTDATIERFARIGTNGFVNGTASSGSARTLTDSGKTMTPFLYSNFRIIIESGTGAGQHRRIINNTATTFTVNRPWDVTPDATSVYKVWGDFDRIMLGGNANSSLYGYSPSNDCWMQGGYFDDGVVNNIAVRYAGWNPFGVTTGTRQPNGITVLNATPTAGGTGYLVGDVLTISTGGTGGKAIVESISTAGAVLSVSLFACGTNYTTGTAKATTGGTGTGCTLDITTVGTNCKVITASNHIFSIGDSVIISGCNSAGYNTTVTILGCDAINAFEFATSEASNMVATSSQSTTVIVDSSKNWTTNEHVGKLVHLMVAGTAPTSQIRWITANTATTLTVATIVAGVNGTSKYTIYDAKAYGTDDLYKPENMRNYGFATGGSTTTLVDSTKNWLVNQWTGYRMRIEGGTGFGSGIIAITSNTATTLTYTTQGFTPDATTHYEIADSWGLLTACTTTLMTETGTKNWPTNIWGGKRVRLMAGTGLGQETSIVSNTNNALTVSTITTGDATTVYSILGIPVRGAGIELTWAYGSSVDPGRYVYFPRGGASNTLDKYDVSRDRWQYGYHFGTQQETYTTGSMYSYDGADHIYLHKDATGRIFVYDIVSNDMLGAYQLTALHSTAIIGNRMEIVSSQEGPKYLYIFQHTGTLIWRALINESI